MSTEDRNYYGVAWAYNGPDGVSPKTCIRRLVEAVEKAGGAITPSPVQIKGVDSFWRQGVRVAESIRWVCENTPIPLRQTRQRVVGHWSLGSESGQFEPVRTPRGPAWSRVDFSGMLSSEKVSALVADAQNSKQALAPWKEELCDLESAPSWVYWALQGERFQLEEELKQVAWDDEAVRKWWQLMSFLVENTSIPSSRHFDIGMGDRGLEIRELPISSRQTRQSTIRTLCLHLPFHHRRPTKLSGLDAMSSRNFVSRDGELVDDILRSWVSPARFWSLRKTLHAQHLTSLFSETTLSDFKALPQASAYKALEKMASGPIVYFNPTPLTSLPKLHAHVPDWPGWRDFLSALEPTGLLTSESQAFLASLEAARLNDSLASSPTAPLRRRF